MIESRLKDRERRNGRVARNLTGHSTGARVSRSLIVELSIPALCARPLNSVVRFLLNGKEQRLESAPLNREWHRTS
jgi:hypothetical protein